MSLGEDKTKKRIVGSGELRALAEQLGMCCPQDIKDREAGMQASGWERPGKAGRGALRWEHERASRQSTVLGQ